MVAAVEYIHDPKAAETAMAHRGLAQQAEQMASRACMAVVACHLAEEREHAEEWLEILERLTAAAVQHAAVVRRIKPDSPCARDAANYCQMAEAHLRAARAGMEES